MVVALYKYTQTLFNFMVVPFYNTHTHTQGSREEDNFIFINFTPQILFN